MNLKGPVFSAKTEWFTIYGPKLELKMGHFISSCKRQMAEKESFHVYYAISFIC